MFYKGELIMKDKPRFLGDSIKLDIGGKQRPKDTDRDISFDVFKPKELKEPELEGQIDIGHKAMHKPIEPEKKVLEGRVDINSHSTIRPKETYAVKPEVADQIRLEKNYKIKETYRPKDDEMGM